MLITTKNQIIAFDPEMDFLNVLHEFEFEHSSIRLNDCKVADNGNLVYSYFMDKKPRQFYGSVGVYSKKEGALEILKNSSFEIASSIFNGAIDFGRVKA